MKRRKESQEEEKSRWEGDDHGQAHGTFKIQTLLDALRASPHSPKAVELCLRVIRFINLLG